MMSWTIVNTENHCGTGVVQDVLDVQDTFNFFILFYIVIYIVSDTVKNKIYKRNSVLSWTSWTPWTPFVKDAR